MAAPSESRQGDCKFQRTICFRYIPIAGAASNVLFSTNIMNPRGFKRLCSPFDHVVSNALWFNAHLGVGLYLFSRKHMSHASTPWRVTYSVFGAVLFNFGTLLFWATTKAAILPAHAGLRTAVGLASGGVFLYLGTRYLRFVDNQITNMAAEE